MRVCNLGVDTLAVLSSKFASLIPPCCVSHLFPNRLSHYWEIPSTLRHIPSRSNTEWPVLLREVGDVVVNAESKMVGDQVLAGGTDVKWIEVKTHRKVSTLSFETSEDSGPEVRTSSRTSSVICSKIIPKGPGVLPLMLANWEPSVKTETPSGWVRTNRAKGWLQYSRSYRL